MNNFFPILFSYNARVVSSTSGGMGKSLFVQEKGTALENLLMSSAKMKYRISRSKHLNTIVVTIPVHGTSVYMDEIVELLLMFEERQGCSFPRIYHFDIAPTVGSLVN